MKEKLTFRILGALASALIIVSVFVPFISVTGYTTSLWQTFELRNSLYLPIMIIVFGVIGVIFFALNIKTEFAYMSVGAVAFFLIMQTMDVLNQGAFNTLSIGYYFLVVGTLITGIMAFLINLKSNKKEIKVEQTIESFESEDNNNLYNMNSMNVPTQDQFSSVETKENLVNSQQQVSEIQFEQPIQQVQEIQTETSTQPVNPVINEIPVDNVFPYESKTINTDLEQSIISQIQTNQINQTNPQPIMQGFSQPVNPVLQEFTNYTANKNPLNENSSLYKSNPEMSNIQNVSPIFNKDQQGFSTQETQSIQTNINGSIPNVSSQEFTPQGVQSAQASINNSLANMGTQQFTSKEIQSTTPSGLDIFGQ